jgi:hypothetical protein
MGTIVGRHWMKLVWVAAASLLLLGCNRERGETGGAKELPDTAADSLASRGGG